MSDAERLARYMAGQRDELVAFVRTLVAFRTDSQSEGNAEFLGEARRCRDLLADEVDALGMRVERCEQNGGYPALAACLPSAGGGRSIALNGHFDVVPPGDAAAWTDDPWSAVERAGRLYGRGTTDMKAGVAALIFALRALRACDVVPGGDVWLHLVSDEEVVGTSTAELVERLPRVDAVIDPEPTSLALNPVEGGLVHVRLEVEGREAHAGTRSTLIHPGAPAQGVSAIDKLLHLLAALRELERQWGKKPVHPMLPPGFSTIMPGLIVGGPGGGAGGRLNVFSNAGTVPNYAAAELNIWYMPYEELEEVRADVERCLHHACQLDPWLAEHPPRLTWKLNGIFFPPVNTQLDDPIIGTLQRALAGIGRPGPVTGFTAASELAWYAEQGIPGTLFGPGSIAQAHSCDEFVPIDEVVDAAAAIAIAIAEYTAAAA